MCLILIIILSGCKKEDTEFKKKDIAPESLSKLNHGINQVLKDIGKIENIEMGIEVEEETGLEMEEPKKESEGETGEKKDEPEGKSEEETEEKPEEESNGKKESKGSQEDDNGSKEDMKSGEDEKNTDEIKKIWKDINKNIEDIHESWSSYTSEVVNKGITLDKRDKFEKSLNKTTKAIEDKIIIDIYDFASQSLVNTKPFFDLYNDEISGDINEIKYSIYQYYIRGITGKKEEAIKVLKDKEENINRIRLKLKDKEDKLKEIDKIIFTLESMEMSLEENSKRLLAIKRDVGIKDLESLE